MGIGPIWVALSGGLYCPPQIPAGFLRIPEDSQDLILADVPANFFSPDQSWD
ncbi:hypothetical protein K443DRAFT_15044 [Laccaria amethystina LaAM-08-1]|uniref:Uncharacterized protein n=1 Tax=Laccaria amethystina LaAM-08-1 TaxID=1095629 RepID=A0A0C9WZ97_9AGAR|nr:hypothetical protein K443DRAFT_15044 [Laccaria amethystina LaAM-08-1]